MRRGGTNFKSRRAEIRLLAQAAEFLGLLGEHLVAVRHLATAERAIRIGEFLLARAQRSDRLMRLRLQTNPDAQKMLPLFS